MAILHISLGANADGMFEDIGHSKDARTKMAEFFVGYLKVGKHDDCYLLLSLAKLVLHVQDDGSKPKVSGSKSSAAGGKQELESKGGLSPIAIIVFVIAIMLGVYFSQQK